MNPAVAHKLLSIEPSVVSNTPRRLQRQKRCQGGKHNSGNRVQEKRACDVPREVGYVSGLGALESVTKDTERRVQASGRRKASPEGAGMGSKPRVVFVSTEVAPWSKVGGLADVVAALPKALATRGGFEGVMSVSPMYEAYDDVVDSGVAVPLPEALLRDDFTQGETSSDSENVWCDKSDKYRGDEGDKDCGDDGRASLFSTVSGGVKRVFVKHPLLDMHRVRTNKEVKNEHPSFTYVEGEGGVYDCHNMDVRYDIMAWGALMAAVALPIDSDGHCGGGSPGSSQKQDVVFVLNDWPTALVAVRLHHMMQAPRSSLSDVERMVVDRLGAVKTVFCIHNLAYQGVFSANAVARDLGLSARSMAPLMSRVPWQDWDRPGSDLDIQPEDSVNFLRAALLLADNVLTVSPHYAQEIASENEEFNCGMGEILRHKNVEGIMNGIDTTEWDPETDKLLPSDSLYNAYTVFRGKNSMKRRLQARLGLVVDDSAVLFVFIGRLTEQKGVDALMRAATRLLPKKEAPHPIASDGFGDEVDAVKTGAGTPSTPETLFSNTTTMMNAGYPEGSSSIQLAMLGTGDQWLEQAVSSLEFNFPGVAVGVCEFSEELAHWMLAAADYCLIPSKFEPCGLIAQCAARYGAVPIMTATGGLKNLGDAGVGILVPRRETLAESVDDLVDAMQTAIEEHGSDVHCDQRAFGMKYDYSWDVHACEWQSLLLDGEKIPAPYDEQFQRLNL